MEVTRFFPSFLPSCCAFFRDSCLLPSPGPRVPEDMTSLNFKAECSHGGPRALSRPFLAPQGSLGDPQSFSNFPDWVLFSLLMEVFLALTFHQFVFPLGLFQAFHIVSVLTLGLLRDPSPSASRPFTESRPLPCPLSS